MKKWWIFVLAAAVACVGIGVIAKPSQETVTVETTRLQPQQLEQTVSCNGVVEAADSIGVFAPTACFLKEVSVRKGATVKAGQVLAKVDKEATRLAGLAEEPQAALALAAMSDTITAPEDGVIIRVDGIVGEPLEEGVPCVVLAPRSSLQVRVAIREKHLRTLREGMPVHVTGVGFSRKSYDGVLEEIASTASNDGGETVVEGVVSIASDQADDSLRLGLTAKAAVVVSSVKDGLVVPYEAVMEDEDKGEYVYVLRQGNAVRCPLKVKAELSEGLLLADTSLSGAELITQPELVTANGEAVAVLGKETA